MNEFQIFKEEIRDRLARTNAVGGKFTQRENIIISILWNSREDIDGIIHQRMAAKSINESGGCSYCGDLEGYGCVCEEEEDQLTIIN